MNDSMKRHKVRFLPDEITIEVLDGAVLMDAMHQSNIYFDFPCGGKKKCGKCRVRIFPDSLAAVQTTDSLDHVSISLACMTKVHDDMTVELIGPKVGRHQVLAVTPEREVRLRSHIKKKLVQVDRPSLTDYRSDWKRLEDALQLNTESISSLQLLRQLPLQLRGQDFKITAVLHNDDLLGVEPGDTTETLLGMAFDIGTTTVVGYLLDLNSGQELVAVSAINPQTQFGADVISRVMYAESPQQLQQLQEAVISVINDLIAEATKEVGLSGTDVYAVSVVGNTTMHHLFLGINPHHIPLAPYVTATSEALVLESKELGLLTNEAARIFVLPNIAGFIGADTVAVLLAAELDRSKEIKLVIDIGTNGEIALGAAEKLVTCSTAAGPAFEGAQISCGMRGSTGAIEHIVFKEREMHYTVIGGGKPCGICGSALLDAIAGLLELGFIDKNGRIVPPEKLTNPKAWRFRDRLIHHDGAWAFLLADARQTLYGGPIMITQQDVREFQMAKGAIASGVKLLAKEYGIEVEDIKEVLLAGAFGNYLNPHSATLIGLIPPQLQNRITMIGNAAGAGAKLALLSAAEYKRAVDIAREVEHVELGIHPRFMKTYAESMYF